MYQKDKCGAFRRVDESEMRWGDTLLSGTINIVDWARRLVAKTGKR